VTEEDEPYRMNEAIKRNMVWDILPHTAVDNGIFQALDMPISTPDGWDMEHQDSHDRTEVIGHLLPVVTTLGAMAASVISRAILVSSTTEIADEQKEAFAAAVEDQVTAGSLAVVTELAALGLITVNEVGVYE
jgi:hypothetical protein